MRFLTAKSKIQGIIPPTLLYIILALILTYPLILNITTAVPGQEDTPLVLWRIWWVSKALNAGTNPYHTDYVFHPNGLTLTLQLPESLNLIVASALMCIYTLEVSYNIIILAAITLSALGMYLLAKELGSTEWPSLLAGFIFAFSPYRMGEIASGHLHSQSIQWMPFYALFMLRGSWWAVPFLLLSGYSDPEYFGFLTIMTVIYVLIRGVREKTIDWKTIRILAAGCALMSPYLAMLMWETLTVAYPRVSSVASIYSLNLLDTPKMYGIAASIVFLLHLRNIGVAAWMRRELEKISGALSNRGVLLWVALAPTTFYFIQPVKDPILYCTAILCVLGFLAFMKLLKEGILDFWSTTTIVFAILSFGPTLQLGKDHIAVMPYFILQYMPLFSLFRTPARFTAVVMLALAAITATALKRADKKWLLVVVALTLMQYDTIPFPLTQPETPLAYSHISGNIIIDVPTGPYTTGNNGTAYTTYYPKYMYWAAKQNLKLVEGAGTRIPIATVTRMKENAFISDVMYGGNHTPQEACLALRKTGATDVVVHYREYEALFDEPGADRLKTLLKSMPCLRVGYDGDIQTLHVVD